MKRIAFLISAALLVLAGCSSNEEKENLKPMPLVDFEPTVDVDRVWSTKVGAGQDRRYTVLVPAVVGDRIYTADVEGNVYAVDGETGKKLWHTDLEKEIPGNTGAGGGLVLVGTYKGEVIALDAETGEHKWTAQASSEILAPPQTNGDVVVAATIDARLFAYDAETGEELWSHDHIAPVLTLRTTAAPLLTSTQVFAGFDNGQLISFSASDGAVGWEVRVAQPKGRHDLEKMVDIDGTPVMDSAFVYATSYQGNVVGIARGNGRVMWKRDASSAHQPVLDDGLLVVATEDDWVTAYTAANGGTQWENTQLLRRNVAAPGIMGDYVVVIDEEDIMHVLDREDGSFVARYKPSGSGFRSPPTAYKDGVLVLSDDGKLGYYRASEKD